MIGTLLLLHGEDGGKDQNAAHEADNIVEEGGHGSELHGTLGALHEGGKGQESAETST